MDDEVRTLLRDAAPAPTSSLDFDRLWLAGRHRRRLGHVGRVTVLVMSVGAAAVVAIAAPLGGTQPGGLEVADRPVSHCPATDVAAAGFTPPEPYPAYPDITGGVWYGSDELWTVVVPDGRSPARSLWWSTDYQGGAAEPGPEIEVVYERLDHRRSTVVCVPRGLDCVVRPENGNLASTGPVSLVTRIVRATHVNDRLVRLCWRFVLAC